MSDITEIKQIPLSPEEIQRDYVNIKAAGQILRDCSETTARRRIKLYESGTQRKIATITEVVNGGVVKLYPRKDIELVAAHFNIIPSVIRYETVSVPQEKASVPNAIPHLEAPKRAVSQPLATSGEGGDEWGRLVRVSRNQNAFSTLLLGVLILTSAWFLWRYMEKDRVSMAKKIEALNAGITRLENSYRDSRLIEDIKVEQRNFFGW